MDYGGLLDGVNNSAIWVAGFLTAVAIIWRLTRKLRKGLVRFGKGLRQMVYDFIGWPEEKDPRSGHVIRERVPGIAERIDRMEQVVTGAWVNGVNAHLQKLDRNLEQIEARHDDALRRIHERIDSWQTKDRMDADTMRAALTEVTHIPLERNTENQSEGA